MPAMVASASGVSCTRSLPKRSCRPAVARNTPPLAPTSWPITTTSASCCISQPCAIAMASTMVIFANSLPAGLSARGPARRRSVFTRHLALFDQVPRHLGEQVIEHGVGRGLRALQIIVHRRVDLAGAFLRPRLFLGSTPRPRLHQVFAHANQGLERPGFPDLVGI